MKDSNPLVSVGIPVYNQEHHLKGALDNLVNQTFTNFELIISDNASTDKTEAISREYADKDPRIAYYRYGTNVGAVRNFNRVVESATGKYFMWASADDRWDPQYIASCLEVLEADPSVVLAYTASKTVDDNGNQTGEYRDPFRIDQDSVTERVLTILRNLRRCDMFYGLIRTKVLQGTPRINRFDLFAYDTVFLVELAIEGKFVQIDEQLFLRCMPYSRKQEDRYARYEKTLFGNHPVNIRLPFCRLAAAHMDVIRNSNLPREDKALLLQEIPEIWMDRYPDVLKLELDRAIRLVMSGRFNLGWSEQDTSGPPSSDPSALNYLDAESMLQDLNEAQLLFADYPGLQMARAACLTHLGRVHEAAAACFIEMKIRPDFSGLRELSQSIGCRDNDGNFRMPDS